MLQKAFEDTIEESTRAVEPVGRAPNDELLAFGFDKSRPEHSESSKRPHLVAIAGQTTYLPLSES